MGLLLCPPLSLPIWCCYLWNIDAHGSQYLFTRVSFEENLERYARPQAPRTCSDAGPSSLYTRTRHIDVMCEDLMDGRARQRLHYLAESRVRPNPQGSRRTLSASAPVAPPMLSESRLRRTVRGPGTPAADAALASVASRRLARCRQPPERL